MRPVIEDLEKELAGQVKITKIDVDKDQETSSKYGIMSIPTYLILKDSEERDRIIGATSKEVLTQKIKAHVS